MNKRDVSFGQLGIETIGLSTPRGRLIFFVLLSLIIFIAPAKWPFAFSIWQHLGVASPSIGLSRAYRYVLHGNFAQAWQQNKLIYLVVAVGLPLLIKDMSKLIRDYKNSRSN